MGRALHLLSEEPESFKAFADLLKRAGGCVAIDGGLATQLEQHGADIKDPLWSALCLITSPDLIRKVHKEYLEAGAEVLVTASYQATLQGFEARGLTQAEGEALLQKSVTIACEERDRFWDQYIDRLRLGLAESGMYRRALIAASIGSYGAFLADGSEYSGDYGPDMTKTKLKDFHRRRLLVLADAGADLLAFETIPCKLEAQAFVEILEEEDIQIPSWLVFNSKDGLNVVNGDSFDECIALAANSKKVVAVGINCTPPRFIDGMIRAARKVTSKPIVVYPNSGECYDGIKKEWITCTGMGEKHFISHVAEWRESGANLIGGCCRTTPITIKAISKVLHDQALPTSSPSQVPTLQKSEKSCSDQTLRLNFVPLSPSPELH